MERRREKCDIKLTEKASYVYCKQRRKNEEKEEKKRQQRKGLFLLI
jgi:hypothetical protein